MDERNVGFEMEEVQHEGNERKEESLFSVTSKHVIIILLIVLAFMGVRMYQMRENYKLKEQELCLISVLITVQEDNLYLKYGVIPEEIGLGDIKDAWIMNPSYDTALDYSEALRMVLEYLNDYVPLDMFESEGIIQV